MKICIIVFSNIRYAPYYHFYADCLDRLNVPYDVIIFNRKPDLPEKGDNLIKIDFISRRGWVGKVLSFILFIIKGKKVIKKNKYEKIIVLTTVPSVLLGCFLIRKYRKRFIVDIRDYTYENNCVFRFIEKKVINNSFLNVISSPSFIKFLPNANYYLCHNININTVQHIKSFDNTQRFAGRKKTISYIGSISYAKQCKKLIDLVVDDEEFEFHFYGNDNTNNTVPQYIEKKNNPRIRYHGEFTPSQKSDIYLTSDIIFNCYGNDSPLTKYALSNKLYDGLLYRKPLLVSPNTSMADILGCFCFELDLDKENDLRSLSSWYSKFDFDEYEVFANKYLQSAIGDNRKTLKAIESFVKTSVMLGDAR